MLSNALIRQYASGQQVSPAVAGQDIVLHYVLTLLNERELLGRPAAGGPPGPLLFKGGTALRKCVFGSIGRFSEDIVRHEAPYDRAGVKGLRRGPVAAGS